MRILFVNYEYPPLGGGGGVACQNLAEQLQCQGHEIMVLTAGTSPQLVDEIFESGLRVIRLPCTQKRIFRAATPILFMIQFLTKGFHYLFKNRHNFTGVDVVHTYFGIPTGPLGWWASKILNKPNVLTLIGGEIYKQPLEIDIYTTPVITLPQKFLIQQATSITAISNDTKTGAQRCFGTNKNIHVVTCGHKFSHYSPEKIPSVNPTIRFITISRIVPRKNLPFLLRAFSQLIDLPWELTVIGDGPEKNTCIKLTQDLNIYDRVNFLDYVSEEKKAQELAASDVFVMTPLHEGLGLVYFEAMQFGLPIISTNNGGQLDFLTNDRNAILLSNNDLSSLVAALKKSILDENWRNEIGTNNSNDIQELSIGKIYTQYLDIYNEAIATHDRAGT
jgi:glycosyltransferase involved in cell wall biosynthesis